MKKHAGAVKGLRSPSIERLGGGGGVATSKVKRPLTRTSNARDSLVREWRKTAAQLGIKKRLPKNATFEDCYSQFERAVSRATDDTVPLLSAYLKLVREHLDKLS